MSGEDSRVIGRRWSTPEEEGAELRCTGLSILGAQRRVEAAHLEDRGPCGVLKQVTPRGRRFLKACSMSLASEDGSILQKEPLPGSSCDRATLMK